VAFARGVGHLVIPIGFAVPVGLQELVERIWGAAFYRAHDQLLPSLSYLGGALVLWQLGRWINPRPAPGEFQVVTVRGHHFFGIRLEYWAIPFALLALLVAVPWERLPGYRPPSGVTRDTGP
jgi:hypothetical protein